MMERSLNERKLDFDENYKRVLDQIEQAALRSGRRPQDVTLLAATKTVPVELINYGISRGLAQIGENRVQELLDKYDALDREHCQAQFIGQLQTNKVKYLTGRVSCIQSLDSVKLAREISRQGEKAGAVMEVLVEVNIGREENKGGVDPDQLYEFIDEIRRMPGLAVHGLMAIPPICSSKAEAKRYFSRIAQYYVDIKGKSMDNVSMECLSMGMSSDFPEAVECGANLVRVGSSLFGPRA